MTYISFAGPRNQTSSALSAAYSGDSCKPFSFAAIKLTESTGSLLFRFLLLLFSSLFCFAYCPLNRCAQLCSGIKVRVPIWLVPIDVKGEVATECVSKAFLPHFHRNAQRIKQTGIEMPKSVESLSSFLFDTERFPFLPQIPLPVVVHVQRLA
jgi:hypothetical protein